MVIEHRGEHPEVVRDGLDRQQVRDEGWRRKRCASGCAGLKAMAVKSEKKERIRQLERENYEFGRANEILLPRKKADAALQHATRPNGS
jgi:hypothetical protein